MNFLTGLIMKATAKEQAIALMLLSECRRGKGGIDSSSEDLSTELKKFAIAILHQEENAILRLLGYEMTIDANWETVALAFQMFEKLGS